jgi:hypothetical protein
MRLLALWLVFALALALAQTYTVKPGDTLPSTASPKPTASPWPSSCG